MEHKGIDYDKSTPERIIDAVLADTAWRMIVEHWMFFITAVSIYWCWDSIGGREALFTLTSHKITQSVIDQLEDLWVYTQNH